MNKSISPIGMTPLEQFFCLFSKIRSGEGKGILLLSLNGFLLVFAYYVLKTIREALILTEFGAETKSYAVAAFGKSGHSEVAEKGPNWLG